MGKNNSSICRVKPFMDYMQKDFSRLVKVLECVGISCDKDDFESEMIFYEGHQGEKALKPPCDYLCKLIETLPSNEFAKQKILAGRPGNTNDARLEMLSSDDERRKSIQQIRKEYSSTTEELKGSIYLEGSSKPDVFIETDDKIIVVEGKWTEPKTTESTSFVKHRNQMVRHLHAALNYRYTYAKNKSVYGFYIVSEEFANRKENAISFNDFKEKLVNQFGIEGAEKDIEQAYRGFITWEMIEEMFPDISDLWKKEPD